MDHTNIYRLSVSYIYAVYIKYLYNYDYNIIIIITNIYCELYKLYRYEHGNDKVTSLMSC